ncbi:MAG: hypothetical protein H8E36_09375 [Rhodospirillaceae bacterium]|nr:hypothetical protein [Rhodospirillaceae bacterium]MBL6940685.1 hypothetical protein [Rhodospirillales bacterium]
MHPPVKSQRPRRRQFVTWLAVLALSLPMLATLAQGVPLSGASEGTQAPFYMVLCKAMQRGTSEPTPAPEQSPDTFDCPVCLGFSTAKSVLLTPLAQSLPCEFVHLAFVINTKGDAGDGRLISHAHARAPPVSV